MVKFISISPGLLGMAMLLRTVSGLWGDEPQSCSRCQLIDGDLLENYLWRFHEVRNITCPQKGDNPDEIYCCLSNFRGFDCCKEPYYQNKHMIAEIERNCESAHNEVIGLSPPFGGTILALLVTAPIIFICAYCHFRKIKKRRAEEILPTYEEIPMNLKEEQPQTFLADSNLLPPSALEQSASAAFAGAAGHTNTEQPPAYTYLYPNASQTSHIKPY
eukprot:GFUD01035035.1.p1 GENE.GFUD01035035.1~~GFUD01035035.1.p1  ORF type:complete len:217 (+),score=36.22 GFUD01035035.1:82-732(+)